MCSVPLETGMPRALTFAIVFCISGLRWSAYSYCALQLRVALVCVFLLCFATQGCAGLRILILLCISGLPWSAYSYCVLQLRVALVCVILIVRFEISGLPWSAYSYCVLQLTGWCWSAYSFCVLLLQACAGLRHLIVFCNSELRWFA